MASLSLANPEVSPVLSSFLLKFVSIRFEAFGDIYQCASGVRILERTGEPTRELCTDSDRLDEVDAHLILSAAIEQF